MDYDDGDLRFKSPDTIEQALIEEGIDGSTPVLAYCRTGYIASLGYFVLDAILDWEVMTYDGSWAQWGKMSDDETKEGDLPPGSAWAVDYPTYMGTINYNVDAVPRFRVERLFLDEDAHAACPSPFSPCANNIEAEDAAYVSRAK